MFAVNMNGTDYYMGTYNTYDTISVSSTWYITGSNAGNKGSTQFYVEFVEAGSTGGTTTPDTPDTPVTPPSGDPVVELEEGKAYNLKMVQGNLGKTLYLAGGLSGEYWTTTADASAAKAVYVEKSGEGYHFYYTDSNGTKTYIEAYLICCTV